MLLNLDINQSFLIIFLLQSRMATSLVRGNIRSASAGAQGSSGLAGVGVRFIVDLEAGKPTLRLENVLRVIDALGGEIQLSGLPFVAADDQGKGDDHGA